LKFASDVSGRAFERRHEAVEAGRFYAAGSLEAPGVLRDLVD
jgi:hypothetical protein